MALPQDKPDSGFSGELDVAFFLPNEHDERHNLILEMLESLPDSILIINTKTLICYVNKSYLDLFNIQKERIVGRHLSKFEPLARIHDVLSTKHAVIGDISHIYSAKMDVISNIAPLMHKGKLIGAIAQMRNITDEVRISKELEHFKSLTQYLKSELSSKEALPLPLRNVLGHNHKFVDVLRMASKAADSDVNVCIDGESGVGKEVLADAIHYSSKRSEGPIIKINCAAIAESLLESELFGYEQGSFTGAQKGGKAGKFEVANGGTIFLDEIGEMPLSMQVKLLRVLQQKTVERVGGTKSIELDFRLITATNRDLAKLVEEGSFREDLYYRIDVVHLSIPPLRERPEDIILYANYFLEEMNSKDRRTLKFLPEVIEVFNKYHWPGNVRELRNCVEYAKLFSTDNSIGLDALPAKMNASSIVPPSTKPNTYKLNELVGWTEREAILSALRITGNNKTQAMKMLGISRRCFYQKLEKYDLLA